MTSGSFSCDAVFNVSQNSPSLVAPSPATRRLISREVPIGRGRQAATVSCACPPPADPVRHCVPSARSTRCWPAAAPVRRHLAAARRRIVLGPHALAAFVGVTPSAGRSRSRYRNAQSCPGRSWRPLATRIASCRAGHLEEDLAWFLSCISLSSRRRDRSISRYAARSSSRDRSPSAPVSPAMCSTRAPPDGGAGAAIDPDGVADSSDSFMRRARSAPGGADQPTNYREGTTAAPSPNWRRFQDSSGGAAVCGWFNHSGRIGQNSPRGTCPRWLGLVRQLWRDGRISPSRGRSTSSPVTRPGRAPGARRSSARSRASAAAREHFFK